MVGDLQLRGCAQLVRRGLAVQHMRTMVAQLEVPSMRNVCSASMDSTKTLRPVRTELPLLPPGGRSRDGYLRRMRRSMGTQNCVSRYASSIAKLQRPMKFYAEDSRRLSLAAAHCAELRSFRRGGTALRRHKGHIWQPKADATTILFFGLVCKTTVSNK